MSSTASRQSSGELDKGERSVVGGISSLYFLLLILILFLPQISVLNSLIRIHPVSILQNNFCHLDFVSRRGVKTCVGRLGVKWFG
ncbi:hypothetical protein AAHA92_14054 [Salvia divinorum]|uniref:Uncharacterized protein n=1 Tax=Salvia divinorum TaxID=28513 RepID=A0ABD1HA95_SALDI